MVLTWSGESDHPVLDQVNSDLVNAWFIVPMREWIVFLLLCSFRVGRGREARPTVDVAGQARRPSDGLWAEFPMSGDSKTHMLKLHLAWRALEVGSPQCIY